MNIKVVFLLCLGGCVSCGGSDLSCKEIELTSKKASGIYYKYKYYGVKSSSIYGDALSGDPSDASFLISQINEGKGPTFLWVLTEGQVQPRDLEKNIPNDCIAFTRTVGDFSFQALKWYSGDVGSPYNTDSVDNLVDLKSICVLNCPDMTYQVSPENETHPEECAPWTICSPGTFQDEKPTSKRNTKCTPCSEGKYSLSEDAQECLNQPICSAGKYVLAQATLTSQRKCGPCVGNLYTDGPNQPTCKSHSSCPFGTYESEERTNTRNTTCAPCLPGFFASVNDTKPCAQRAKVCEVGSYEKRPPTTTSDTQCESCQIGKFQNERDAKSCKNKQVCGPGLKCSAESAFNVTKDCSCVRSCPRSQYESRRSNVSFVCNNITAVCPAGTFVNGVPTSTSDRICTPCDQNSFQNVSTLNSICRSHSSCGLGEFEKIKPSRTTDRVCEECPPDTFIAAGMKICSNISSCNASEYAVANSTSSTDRVCKLVPTTSSFRIPSFTFTTQDTTIAQSESSESKKDGPWVLILIIVGSIAGVGLIVVGIALYRCRVTKPTEGQKPPPLEFLSFENPHYAGLKFEDTTEVQHSDVTGSPQQGSEGSERMYAGVATSMQEQGYLQVGADGGITLPNLDALDI
eukprot:m.27182 g.27182  ORF g.27182 m.27182 type:complete len:630 (-) comp7871_c0_seq1:74-1963(-)